MTRRWDKEKIWVHDRNSPNSGREALCLDARSDRQDKRFARQMSNGRCPQLFKTFTIAIRANILSSVPFRINSKILCPESSFVSPLKAAPDERSAMKPVGQSARAGRVNMIDDRTIFWRLSRDLWAQAKKVYLWPFFIVSTIGVKWSVFKEFSRVALLRMVTLWKGVKKKHFCLKQLFVKTPSGVTTALNDWMIWCWTINNSKRRAPEQHDRWKRIHLKHQCVLAILPSVF